MFSLLVEVMRVLCYVLLLDALSVFHNCLHTFSESLAHLLKTYKPQISSKRKTVFRTALLIPKFFAPKLHTFYVQIFLTTSNTEMCSTQGITMNILSVGLCLLYCKDAFKNVIMHGTMTIKAILVYSILHLDCSWLKEIVTVMYRISAQIYM